MSIFAVFNELSVDLQEGVQDQTIYMARQWIKDFARLFYEARQRGVIGLRTYKHFHDINLIEGYSLMDWANDDAVDLELRLRIKGLFQELYRIPEFPENGQGDPLYESRYNGRIAHGLGAAHLLQSLAISLLTKSVWDTANLSIEITEIDEETGEISEISEDIRHISTINHLDVHKLWIRQSQQNTIRNSHHLWTRKHIVFPNLLFCNSTEVQFKALQTPHFRQVMLRLAELEEYCRQWKSGLFDHKKIRHCTGEYETTLQMFGTEHTFTCPDGEERLFKYHTRFTPGDGRIFFFPLATPAGNKIIIGHVGGKLPTQKYPNPT